LQDTQTHTHTTNARHTTSADAHHAAYKALVAELLAAKGKSVEGAAATHAAYPFVLALGSLDEFGLLVQEAVASAESGKSMAAAAEWVPPPPDAVPETAQDYE
jgi:hypothetical protein